MNYSTIYRQGFLDFFVEKKTKIFFVEKKQDPKEFRRKSSSIPEYHSTIFARIFQ